MNAHDNLEEFSDPPNYDNEEGERSAPRIAFYCDLARTVGGPALEIACGSGLVTIPVAAQGLKVTGVDCAALVSRMQKHFVTALPITPTGHGQKREPGIASMKITSGTGGTANSHRQSANPLHVRIKILGRSSSSYDCLARQTG